MATYFSNHSQSRFPLGQQQTQQPSSSSTVASQNHPPLPSGLSQANSGAKLRSASGSKHFSTTVSSSNISASTSEDRKSGTKGASALDATGTENHVHPLRNTWVFWFRQQRSPGNKIVNYEEGIKKISSFSSVESFWPLWTHLNPPSTLTPTTDYLLFHSAIRRPVWEDPLNITGGKWIIRLRKGVADRLWEDLVLGIIGDQFSQLDDDCENKGRGSWEEDSEAEGGGVGPEICGCTVSVRQHEDIISVWNRVDGDKKDQIRDNIRRVLNLPSSTVMEYKSNNDSMQDKSSFRTPAADRTPIL